MGLLRVIFHFIIEISFGIIATLILLRFFLQCVKANFYHPVIQALVKVTNPILIPIRRITPTFSRFDWACFVLLFILGIVKYLLYISLTVIPAYNPSVILGFIVLDTLASILYLYLFLFLIHALSSWLNPSPQMNLILNLIRQLTDPILRKIKLKPMSQFDFRPMVIVLLIFLGFTIINYFRYQLL